MANNGNGEADVGSVTISVTDVNDITPVYQAADADDAISVNENVGTGSIDAVQMVMPTQLYIQLYHPVLMEQQTQSYLEAQ